MNMTTKDRFAKMKGISPSTSSLKILPFMMAAISCLLAWGPVRAFAICPPTIGKESGAVQSIRVFTQQISDVQMVTTFYNPDQNKSAQITYRVANVPQVVTVQANSCVSITTSVEAQPSIESVTTIDH
jgi:hypothetical protein